MKNNNFIKESSNNAINNFIKKAKELLKDNLVDVLIYGSVIRGEATPDSDIDIIIVVKKNTFRTQMRLAALAFEILMETGEYISVQTMKTKDINRDTIFLHNVRQEAVHAI